MLMGCCLWTITLSQMQTNSFGEGVYRQKYLTGCLNLEIKPCRGQDLCFWMQLWTSALQCFWSGAMGWVWAMPTCTLCFKSISPYTLLVACGILGTLSMKAKRNGDASRADPAQISPLKQSKSAGNFLSLPAGNGCVVKRLLCNCDRIPQGHPLESTFHHHKYDVTRRFLAKPSRGLSVTKWSYSRRATLPPAPAPS